jgi:hypothetical protein
VLDLGQAGRVDDDRSVHAVADVVQGRRGAAVVHVDAGVLGLELVDQSLPEVDGEQVAHAAAQGRSRDLAVEAPGLLLTPGATSTIPSLAVRVSLCSRPLGAGASLGLYGCQAAGGVA